ncbi:MAG: hypothetical protein Q8M07_27040 [Prosthecobacter sp.]|nr:hypothetical protein [Prosthecobacter sp.]
MSDSSLAVLAEPEWPEIRLTPTDATTPIRAMVMTSSSSENPDRRSDPHIVWVEAENDLENMMDILNVQIAIIQVV